jgi:F-type H+-transporting ATPase subunit epsilon
MTRVAVGVTFRCTVITPERKVIDVEATFVAFPAHDGEIGVLRDRAPLVCKLGTGVLRIEAASEDHRLFIDGGFAQVLRNQVTILSEQALRADEIDLQETRAALEQARSRKATTGDQIEKRQRDIRCATAKLKTAAPGRS